MFALNQVVPWGRSFDEYRRMFALTDADSRTRVLGCGDGPASFNVEATRAGWRVVSCDPIYRFGAAQIADRIASTRERVLEETTRNAAGFVWSESIPDVETLGQVRMAAMGMFLEDFERGKAEGRYVDASLPRLPFSDLAFDLSVCSHIFVILTRQSSL
jgi:hypothetical protein